MSEISLSHETLQESPKILRLSIAGRGDYDNGRQIETYFDQMIESDRPRHVLLDLSELAYAGSSFFGSMLFWRETMTNQGGVLVLYGLHPHVASALRICALDRVLKICPDRQSALQAVGG